MNESYTSADLPRLQAMEEKFYDQHLDELKKAANANTCCEKNEANLAAAIAISNHNKMVNLQEEIKQRATNIL